MPKKKNNKGNICKKDAKSFALKNWKDFEKLSLQIVRQLYNDIPGVVSEITPLQSDGGFDGFLCFPAMLDDTTIYKILLEAKLRSSSGKDLPLSDFAKTIIIAINTISDKVYISTNAYFSEKTVERLSIYSQRTGLEIRTIDICDIVSWIKENRSEAERICNSDFLEDILSMAKTIPASKRKLAPKATEINSCEVSIPELIGGERKRQLNRIATRLSHESGIIGIRAVVGAGKTVFSEHLILKLSQQYKKIINIDFSYFPDVRGVFIDFLASVWGVTAEEIYGMSERELSDVTQRLDDKHFPQNAQFTLLNIIHQPQSQFDNNTVLHTELLLSYLRIIVPPLLKRLRCLVRISNLNKASAGSLSFLCSLMKILDGNPVSFLILIDERGPHSVSNEVNSFLTEIKRIHSYICIEELAKWEHTDAYEYLCKYVPQVGLNDRNQIISYFGTLPLILSAGVEALKSSTIRHLLPFPDSLPHSIIYTSLTVACVEQIIEDLSADGGEIIQAGFALLGLLDGKADISLISDVLNASGLEHTITRLQLCPILRRSGSKLYVIHGVYLDGIQKYNYISRMFLAHILEVADRFLDKYFEDPNYVLRKRFFISKTTRNYELMKNIWMKLVSDFLQCNEQLMANDVLRSVYEWWMEKPQICVLSEYQQFWLLFHLSETAMSLYGAETPELQNYFEQIDVILKVASDIEWPGGLLGLNLARARILNTKCQVLLGRAEYKKMLDFAGEGIALLESDVSPQGKSCLGALWADKSMAIKHIYGLPACIEFLKSGAETLNGVDNFTNCYYSHLASSYTSSDPTKALNYFEKIKKECNCSLSQRLHAEHNIATMNFMLGQYERACKICKAVWIEAYENNVIIEEGRSEHLLGCISWVNDDLESARNHFFRAYDIFNIHTHRTHFWPPLINLSSVCIQMGDVVEGIHYADLAADFILKFHLNNLNHLSITADDLPKLYVGMLILLNNYERTGSSSNMKERILSEVQLPAIESAYNEYIVPAHLEEYLNGHRYVFGGRFIIKI